MKSYMDITKQTEVNREVGEVISTKNFYLVSSTNCKSFLQNMKLRPTVGS